MGTCPLCPQYQSHLWWQSKEKLEACTHVPYHFDHLSNSKVLLCEVSCFSERGVEVVARGLRAVWVVGS